MSLNRKAATLSGGESQRIRLSVQIGSESVAASSTRRQPRELWKIFVLLGLLVLLGEWYVYNKRIFV